MGVFFAFGLLYIASLGIEGSPVASFIDEVIIANAQDNIQSILAYEPYKINKKLNNQNSSLINNKTLEIASTDYNSNIPNPIVPNDHSDKKAKKSNGEIQRILATMQHSTKVDFEDEKSFMEDFFDFDDYKPSGSSHLEAVQEFRDIIQEENQNAEPDFEIAESKHEDTEKHGEVHYHEHKHIHQHDHKAEHSHKHKQEHVHKHGHKHEAHHKHGHAHKHENHHKHSHHHGHKHEHQSKHEHGHKHEHKEDHKSGHKHDHKHQHSQYHKHGHKHGHEHHNEHTHKHHQEHKHKHHDEHRHQHGHNHHHGHKHGHEHDHGHEHHGKHY